MLRRYPGDAGNVLTGSTPNKMRDLPAFDHNERLTVREHLK